MRARVWKNVGANPRFSLDLKGSAATRMGFSGNFSLELRPHAASIPKHAPKQIQHRIVSPPEVQMPDAPACEDERRPEFIMGTR